MTVAELVEKWTQRLDSHLEDDTDEYVVDLMKEFIADLQSALRAS